MRQLEFHCIREDWPDLLRLAAQATETVPAVETFVPGFPLAPIEDTAEMPSARTSMSIYFVPAKRESVLASHMVGERSRLDDEHSERLVKVFLGSQENDGVHGGMVFSTNSRWHHAEDVNKIRNQISDIAKSWRTCLRRVWWISTQITPYSDGPTIESLWVTKNALDWVEHNDSFLLVGRRAAIPHAGIFRQRRLAVLALPTYERSGE